MSAVTATARAKLRDTASTGSTGASSRFPRGGDGATFSEGIGHLIHGVRSNYPITFVLHNNTNYGLTTGQASSLTPQGQPMNTSPNGIPEHTLASMDLIFSLNPCVCRKLDSAILMVKAAKDRS